MMWNVQDRVKCIYAFHAINICNKCAEIHPLTTSFFPLNSAPFTIKMHPGHEKTKAGRKTCDANPFSGACTLNNAIYTPYTLTDATRSRQEDYKIVINEIILWEKGDVRIKKSRFRAAWIWMAMLLGV